MNRAFSPESFRGCPRLRLNSAPLALNHPFGAHGVTRPTNKNSCFETRSLPALARSYPCRFTFYFRKSLSSIPAFLINSGVSSRFRYCTVTSVPTGISEKNLRAVSAGNRMQPCDAGKFGT
jgi:hypothetical protein